MQVKKVLVDITCELEEIFLGVKSPRGQDEEVPPPRSLEQEVERRSSSSLDDV